MTTWAPKGVRLVTMADSVWIRGGGSPSRRLRDEHVSGVWALSSSTVRWLAFGRSGTQDATPLPPLPSGAPVGQDGPMREGAGRDLGTGDQAEADLGAPELTCPHCPGQLRRWGFARTRSLRSFGGGRVWLRPRRVRCANCRVTHVLLPALAPPHRAYTIDLVGQALLASAAGQRRWPESPGHRRRPGRTPGHGARLDPAGKGTRRVAARPRHHQGPHVGPDAAGDRPGRLRAG